MAFTLPPALNSWSVGPAVSSNVSGPAARMVWSTYRFEPKEWKGTTVRLFTTACGGKGQGFGDVSLTRHETNMELEGSFPVPVNIKAVAWELRHARVGPVEELARASQYPACREESLMGLVSAAAFSVEATATVFGSTLLSSDLPKGQFPWRNIEDWRGGHSFGNAMFHIPLGCPFAIRIEILDNWHPVYPTTLRVILDLT